MSKFFGCVNEVDFHNKSGHSDLALEKYWVTQCGWIRLCTKGFMGVNIINLWKLFHHRVKRYNYDRLVGIR